MQKNNELNPLLPWWMTGLITYRLGYKAAEEVTKNKWAIEDAGDWCFIQEQFWAIREGMGMTWK